MDEAGHHADYENHVEHHHDADHSHSLTAELICDGWHGYLDSPPLLAITAESSKPVLTCTAVRATILAVRIGKRFSVQTRAPPHQIT